VTETLTRNRIIYRRGPELRYVGNLDMQLVWERTIRRANLPVAFSQGFSPRPRFHMAAALPLGFTSNCEIIDIWLNGEMQSEVLRESLQPACPPGLTISSIDRIDLGLPALQTQVEAAEFMALLREVPEGFMLEQEVQRLLESPTLPRERRSKPYDLRPLILSLTVTASSQGDFPRLEMRLSAKEGATGRPEEVLAALGLDPTTARVERTGLALNQAAVS
jgi:radical SAM-linked protein